MTHQNDYTFADEIAEKGLEAIPELMRVLINNAMQVEKSKYLQAEQYERTEERKGHANEFKPKTVKTRMGEITFAVPQVREGGFYPSALEKGLRSERALTITLAEMYVQGVSTRKVKAITEQLCGTEISSTQVSRATAQLDAILQEWRERPLSEITYLYVDARYEKVREAGQVRDAAVLLATGISPEGERQVLGVSVSLSEHEAHWKALLKSLKDRGLNGVKLVISDDHEGLGAARRAVFGSVPWQRCQFCQFTDVNAPPLFGNTTPAICGRDAPLGEPMQKQSSWKFKVRTAWSAPPRVVSCGPGNGSWDHG